ADMPAQRRRVLHHDHLDAAGTRGLRRRTTGHARDPVSAPADDRSAGTHHLVRGRLRLRRVGPPPTDQRGEDNQQDDRHDRLLDDADDGAPETLKPAHHRPPRLRALYSPLLGSVVWSLWTRPLWSPTLTVVSGRCLLPSCPHAPQCFGS